MLISLDRLARLLMSPDAGPDAGGGAAVADTPAPEAAGGDEFADPGEIDDDYASDPGPEDLPAPAGQTDQPTGDTVADDTAPDTEGEVAEPSGEPTDATQQPPQGIDEDLLGLAETFGLPAAVARGFGNSQALAAHLSLLAQVRPKPAPAPQDQQQYQLPESLQQHLQKMQDEGVSEEIVAAVRLGFETQGKDLAMLQQAHAGLMAVSQQQAQAQRESWFDQQVNDAGLGQVFGKGTIRELSPDSPEAKARFELYKQFDHWVKQGVPEQQAYKVAFHSLHGDKLQQIARQQVEQKVETFNSQRTSRPTQRASRPPTGREAALAEARKTYAGWSMAEDSTGDDSDGLL